MRGGVEALKDLGDQGPCGVLPLAWAVGDHEREADVVVVVAGGCVVECSLERLVICQVLGACCQRPRFSGGGAEARGYCEVPRLLGSKSSPCGTRRRGGRDARCGARRCPGRAGRGVYFL